MAVYRYQFCDLLTGVILDEFPLDCRSFTQVISGVGTLTATLPLGDLELARSWRGATTQNRTLLVVLRDEQVVWAGPVVKRRPTDDKGAAELSAVTMEGYWAARRIKTDLTETAVDVFTIIRDIVTQCQAVTNGNVQMAVTAGLAGQVATVTYLGKDRVKALDAWNRLAEVPPGFELTITWTRTANTYTPTLTLAAPGLSGGLGALALEYPGNLMAYDYPEDGSAAPNALTGVGADLGGNPILFEAVDGAQMAAGYPIWEDEVAMKEETDIGRLAARTQTALTAGLADYVVPTCTLRGDADPGFGDFPLGVGARLRATSLYHPAGPRGEPGLDVTRRVTGWTVTPGPFETVALTLGSTTGKITPPARLRDQAAALADMDRRMRTLETA